MKFQISTCDAGDSIFKLYLPNVSTEHSLNTATKGRYTQCGDTW